MLEKQYAIELEKTAEALRYEVNSATYRSIRRSGLQGLPLTLAPPSPLSENNEICEVTYLSL